LDLGLAVKGREPLVGRLDLVDDYDEIIGDFFDQVVVIGDSLIMKLASSRDKATPIKPVTVTYFENKLHNSD